MAGISRYERIILCFTAVFSLGVGAWCIHSQETSVSCQVAVDEDRYDDPVPDRLEVSEMDCPDSIVSGELIDVNTADLYELQRLPGIGEQKAKAIIAYRTEHGPFSALEELEQVKGIGPAIRAGLEDFAAVGPMEG